MEFSVVGKNLSKVFDSKIEQIEVISDLEIKIIKGKFTSIMGTSGSGKSTLLYLLSGLDTPTTGNVEIDNKLIDTSNEAEMASIRRSKIGFVFQDHNLISNLTIKENILVAGYLSGTERNIIKSRVHKLLEQFEIEDLSNRYPSEVSGGQKQRCAIARAMINLPLIIMADEPTGNLNSASSQKILECFKSIKEEGQTILMVTHDPKAASYGDHVLYMKDGHILDEISFPKKMTLQNRHVELIDWLKTMGW